MSGETNKVTLPTIHLNGSSAEVLQNQYESALNAVAEALGALYNASPNARDYYVQGEDVFGKASREHRARIAKIEEVRDELQVIQEHIANQKDARARR